jgi:hypothetical protein
VTSQQRRDRQPGRRAPSRSGPAVRSGSRAPRPLPPGHHLLSSGASPERRAVEERSASTVLWLHQLPRWLLPLVTAGLLVTGLAVRGVIGAVALCGVAAVLGWLAALSWPRLSTSARLLRIAAVATVLAFAAVRALH